MSMSKITKLPSDIDSQKTLNAAYNQNVTKMYDITCIATFVIFALYTQIPTKYICIFRENKYLFTLWPLNFIYIAQMNDFSYAYKDQYLLLTSTSTAGIAWLFVFTVRLPQQIATDKILHKDRSFVSCLYRSKSRLARLNVGNSP